MISFSTSSVPQKTAAFFHFIVLDFPRGTARPNDVLIKPRFIAWLEVYLGVGNWTSFTCNIESVITMLY